MGNRLLREYAGSIGLDSSFLVIDRGDSSDLIDMLRQDLALAHKAKRFPRKDTCLSICSHRVNTRNTSTETLEQAFPWCVEWGDELTTLFRRYVEDVGRIKLTPTDSRNCTTCVRFGDFLITRTQHLGKHLEALFTNTGGRTAGSIVIV